jgi:hypothetical protein
MDNQSPEPAVGPDEPMIDGAFIENDLGIVGRSRRNYRARGILPAPDANLLGRDLWRLSTYRRFKADLLAGKFAMVKRPPHLRSEA